MIGVIVNRYSKQRSHVELTRALSVADGHAYLVSKREFEGGKIHLNTFATSTLEQTSEVVIRGSLKIPTPQLAA
jgi:hypothetical protein